MRVIKATFTVIVPGFIIICGDWHKGKQGKSVIYPGDSFFTLSPGGQVGLALLSACLSLGLLWMTLRLARRFRHWLARITLALVVFWTFLWLSPQVYYAYYFLIFDDLPLQLVIKAPTGPSDLVQLLLFRGAATLSAHGAGLLGWGLLVMSLLAGCQKCRDAAN